jgi:hypothetical protein
MAANLAFELRKRSPFFACPSVSLRSESDESTSYREDSLSELRSSNESFPFPSFFRKWGGLYRPRSEVVDLESVIFSFGVMADGEDDLSPYTRNICKFATKPATLRFYALCYNQKLKKHICCKHRIIFSFLYLHALKVNLSVLKEPNANNE